MNIPGELIPIVLFIMIGLTFVFHPRRHQAAALPAGADRSAAPR
ncbi:MAG: hypothetical protein ACR2L6_08635 [Gemmatimonadaceae bacterium]